MDQYSRSFKLNDKTINKQVKKLRGLIQERQQTFVNLEFAKF